MPSQEPSAAADGTISWRSGNGLRTWPWVERRSWFWRLVAWKTYGFLTSVSLLHVAIGLLTGSHIVVYFHGVLSTCLAALTAMGYKAGRPRVPWHTVSTPRAQG